MTIMIAEKFRGPPRSGNGGYVSGAFAKLLAAPDDAAIEVTLRSPVPLDSEMTTATEGDGLQILSGDTLVAEVRASTLDMDIPVPPTFADALAAQPASVSLQPREGSTDGVRGFHPWCYCCGAEHEDGLYVYASRINEEQAAAAWKTRAEWGDSDGNLPAELLWTALDCPGQVAFAVEGIRTGLLGRITARIHHPAPAGDDYVVTAWREGIEGKKHFAGTAIFDAEGTLIASARAIWIGRRN